MVQPLRQSQNQYSKNSSNTPENHQSTNKDIYIGLYIFSSLSLSQILLFMLLSGPHDPLKLLLPNKLLFSITYSP